MCWLAVRRRSAQVVTRSRVSQASTGSGLLCSRSWQPRCRPFAQRDAGALFARRAELVVRMRFKPPAHQDLVRGREQSDRQHHRCFSIVAHPRCGPDPRRDTGRIVASAGDACERRVEIMAKQRCGRWAFVVVLQRRLAFLY